MGHRKETDLDRVLRFVEDSSATSSGSTISAMMKTGARDEVRALRKIVGTLPKCGCRQIATMTGDCGDGESIFLCDVCGLGGCELPYAKEVRQLGKIRGKP